MIADGALRGSTRRVFAGPTQKPLRIGLVAGVMDSLRRHDVVAVGGRIESAANAWIGEPGQREDRGFELKIGTPAGRKAEVWVGHVPQPWAQLVLRSRIGAGAEVAARAGLHTVTPDLHVPEKGFAEGARHGGIPDEVV